MADPIAPDVIATDPRLGALSALTTRIEDIPRDGLLTYLIDAAPSAYLDELVRQFHVAGIEGGLLAATDDERRRLIKASIALHRKKGTPWAMREIFKALGFNGLDIQERLPSHRYDGAITFDGAEAYAAYGWAQFRVTADAGDTQPITAEQTALIVKTIEEWKPARSHLADVRYRASVKETLRSSEATTVAAELSQEESHLWGRRLYDGSIAFSQGRLHTHDGSLFYSGAADYAGFTADGERFDSEREADEMAGILALSDVQSRGPLFDGFGDYGGALDFGASAPVAEDPPMEIIMIRRRRYDGRHAFSAHRYDGAGAYVGEFAYFGNIPYAGDVSTTLEAR